MVGTSPSEFIGLNQFDNLRFNVSDLESALFHLNDIVAFELRHPDLLKMALPSQTGQLGDLEPRLAEAQKKVEATKIECAELKNALEERDALIAELRQRPITSGPPHQLERGKQEKTADRWKEHLQTAVTLAVHVMTTGGVFTTDDLDRAVSKLGCPAFGVDAMSIFRKAMPQEYINTGGRPASKETSK